MPVWKLQTQIWMDSVLARDAFVITPHFNQGGIGSDAQSLCDDWAAFIDTWTPLVHQITVKAYDAQGSVPVYPEGEATLNVGSAPAGDAPREVALCLSFYADRNIPRHRGRLYIPHNIVNTSESLRPSAGERDFLGELAQGAADLGGVDTDWCIFSRSDNVARSVSTWWVDDEWDTVRSRGLRATTRTMGTVGE